MGFSGYLPWPTPIRMGYENIVSKYGMGLSLIFKTRVRVGIFNILPCGPAPPPNRKVQIYPLSINIFLLSHFRAVVFLTSEVTTYDFSKRFDFQGNIKNF